PPQVKPMITEGQHKPQNSPTTTAGEANDYRRSA
ncbi:MAG: hypothetical protein ACI9CF_001212, partial [Candidatus Omnitrophota bacterium]